MTDDTPALTSHDLETIKAALWPVWFELQSRGEQPAADWIGEVAHIAGHALPRCEGVFEGFG